MKPINILMLGACLEQNGGIATVEKLILEHAPDNIKIQHICTHDEGSISHRLQVFGKALATFISKLITEKIDVVHIHISDGGSLVRKAIVTLIGVLFGKPVLMHAHGAEFHTTYFKLPKWAQKLFAATFRLCRGFIVLSNTWKDFYMLNLALKNERMFVLPNPVVIPAQIPLRTNVEKVKLVFFGRVGQRKGAFDLIQAFAKLPAEEKNRAELILAGDGEVEQARQLAAELKVGDRVTLLGWINAQQRDEILPKADIFVLPSYNEGLPMAILEAMSWGLPILTTPVGGIPELIISQENGLLVTPGDVEQLSLALQNLIADEDLRLSLGKAGRETVAAFDVNNYCERLAEIYRSVL